ncbi:hypothetical protein CCHL11_07297 [Colletotrichum chlorophyti]|uniref:Asteroid domain-containing protein n=1 Tax=Colletotrichum chlorophyti TaxID=708187 RepID=A0A1Q8RAA4_9PEZI|nr:hypothetical protein CCHL11_07297 [Colletotrichum chlorophyti]
MARRTYWTWHSHVTSFLPYRVRVVGRELTYPSAAIYFDGFLPSSKAQVRLDRILKVSTQLKIFRSGFPNGCPARQIAATRLMLPRLFPTDPPKRDLPLIPPPPFLVSAVVDKLNQIDKYASLILLVPGEADAYCADDVMRNGGTILTSDSDLAIHDLNEGAVMFFRDLHISSSDSKKSLIGRKYSPSDVAKRLQLPKEQGMRRFAYELSKMTRPKFAQVLENCKGEVSDTEDYRVFCEPYEALETTDWSSVPVLGSLKSPCLDARLSEVVLQCVGYSGVAKPSMGDSSVEGCMMCLPPLLDCPARASAWDSSASVRQLAYSLTCLLRPGTVSHAVALQLILAHSLEEDKQDVCIAAIKLAQSVAEDSTLIPWDVVHLSAQVQAMLYSLRILAQVLNLMSEIKAPGPIQGSRQLRELLSTLPPLTTYPTVDGTTGLVTSLKATGALAKMAIALGIPEDNLLPSREGKSRKKKRKSRNESEAQARPEKKASSNPFDVLGLE